MDEDQPGVGQVGGHILRTVQDAGVRGAAITLGEIADIMPDDEQVPARRDGGGGPGQDALAVRSAHVEVGEEHEVEGPDRRSPGEDVLDPGAHRVGTLTESVDGQLVDPLDRDRGEVHGEGRPTHGRQPDRIAPSPAARSRARPGVSAAACWTTHRFGSAVQSRGERAYRSSQSLASTCAPVHRVSSVASQHTRGV